MDKFFLKSKTIIGIIISMLPTLLPAVGLGTDDTQLVSSNVDTIIQASGALLAVYGRFKAKGAVIISKEK